MERPTLLFIGATGATGRHIIEGISKDSFRIKALSRDPEKAAKLLPPNVEIVEGNLTDVRRIEPMLEGVSCLFINLGLYDAAHKSETLPNQIKLLLVFARMHRVAHVMLHSMLAEGTATNSGAEPFEKVVAHLFEHSGLNYTIFKTSVFMENFFFRFRHGKQIRVCSENSAPIYWISAKDFGTMVSNSFGNPAVINRSVVVQGIEGISMHAAAELFVASYQKEKLSVQRVNRKFRAFFSAFRPKMKQQADWMEMVCGYEEEFAGNYAWNHLGVPMTTLKDFARQGSLGVQCQNDAPRSGNVKFTNAIAITPIMLPG